MTITTSTPDPDRALRCLSLGAGIQSSAVLLLGSGTRSPQSGRA